MMRAEFNGRTDRLASVLPETGTATTHASARSLRRVLIVGVSLSAMVILGLVAGAGIVVLKKSLAREEDAQILNAATLSRQLVERVLAERVRQVDLIASAPS